MKIKTDNIDFVSFSDGVCDIYTIDENEKKIYKYENLGFDDLILGYKRFWAAAANQIKVNKVIKIPRLNKIDTYDKVTINGIDYDIKLVQYKPDTNPPSIDLTLQQT